MDETDNRQALEEEHASGNFDDGAELTTADREKLAEEDSYDGGQEQGPTPVHSTDFEAGYLRGAREAGEKMAHAQFYGGAIASGSGLGVHYPQQLRAATIHSLIENHTRAGRAVFDTTNLIYGADAIARYITDGTLPGEIVSSRPTTQPSGLTPEASERKPMIITPTPGRIVWYYSAYSDPERAKPLAAIVSSVWDHGEVSLCVFGQDGEPISYTGVPLVQEGQEYPVGRGFCTWMPYQLGQAKKHAA